MHESANRAHLLYGHQAVVLFAPTNRTPVLINLTSTRPLVKNLNLRRQKLFIAGLFNTGTNYAWGFLRLGNCISPNGTHKGIPLGYQVMYSRSQSDLYKRSEQNLELFRSGKHTYLPTLFENYRPAWNYILPNPTRGHLIVMVRHPLTWMPSMCKKSWACDIGVRHTQLKQQGALAGTGHGKQFTAASCIKGVLERPVHCRDNRGHNHTSLAHLWVDWIGAYMNKAHPSKRVFVRYEDLLLHPDQIFALLCPCLGASVARIIQKVNRYADPQVRTQHNATRWMDYSRAKAESVNTILQPFTARDLMYLRKHAGRLLNRFRYRLPSINGHFSGDSHRLIRKHASAKRNLNHTHASADDSFPPFKQQSWLREAAARLNRSKTPPADSMIQLATQRGHAWRARRRGSHPRGRGRGRRRAV